MRQFSRRPETPVQWLLFLGGCVAIILWLASFSHTPKYTPPPTPTPPAGANGWPAGSTAREMCAADGGVTEALLVGGARPGQLPPGSQVACKDGSIQNVRLT